MDNKTWEDYKELEKEKDWIRKMIDGLLNRISVSDSDDERLRAISVIILHMVDYYKKSKESHELYKELNKTLEL